MRARVRARSGSLVALAIPLACALGACGPEFAVRPPGGAPHVTGSTSGVLLTAFADQWSADPRDLADLVTPVAVDIYNGTSVEVRVALADFALRTEGGARLPALNPFSIPVARGELPPGPLLAGPLRGPAGGMLVAGVHVGPPSGMGFRGAGRGGGFIGRGPGRSWGSRHHGHFGGYGGGSRGYGRLGPRWGAGFYVSGGLRGWYGPGVTYWSGPWGYPGGYGAWGWSASGLGDTPSQDVIEFALPEGVLAPGAHVNGFLYFQRATSAQTRTLGLAWQPHDARAGTPIGEASVTLEVVRR